MLKRYTHQHHGTASTHQDPRIPHRIQSALLAPPLAPFHRKVILSGATGCIAPCRLRLPPHAGVASKTFPYRSSLWRTTSSRLWSAVIRSSATTTKPLQTEPTHMATTHTPCPTRLFGCSSATETYPPTPPQALNTAHNASSYPVGAGGSDESKGRLVACTGVSARWTKPASHKTPAA